ncbi:hypothetical protein SteCoe_29620 [Stentor coeruleus]|uniref:Hexose transporter 1 n=1 Tax=Stentor coeruleus TaxID=5963 RepID=A0A1R2B5M1_9CILI|nr:hypothetical protein SteCoe_29620 [Stentor coeruleus]
MGYKEKYLIVTVLHIAMCGFLFSYTLSVMNTCADNIGASLDWGDNQDFYVTLFSTLVPFGAIFGGMATGVLSNKYGRRGSIMIMDAVMLFGSCIAILPSTLLFGVGRFITGVASGFFLTIGPVFINEITPDELIPTYGPIIQITNNTGIVLAYFLGLPLPTTDYKNNNFNNWWIFMLFIPGILSFYQLCYFLLCNKHDSPLWLLRYEKQDEAILALRQVYNDEDLEKGINRFNRNSKEDSKINSSGEKEYSYYEIFKLKKFKKMLRNGIMLGIIQQLSGVNTAVIYSTYIFEELGGSAYMARIYTIITVIVFFMGCFLSIFLLNKFGRKTLLIFGTLSLSVDMLLLGIVTLFNFHIIFAVILISAFYVFFAFSLGATLWTYIGEALIEKIASVSSTVIFTMICVVSGLFPIFTKMFGIYYCFFFFSLCMAFGGCYIWKDLIETRGKSKCQILGEMYFH